MLVVTGTADQLKTASHVLKTAANAVIPAAMDTADHENHAPHAPRTVARVPMPAATAYAALLSPLRAANAIVKILYNYN